MNVNYYYKLFDSVYTSFYIDELGFGEDYLKSGFSTFTLEDSIRYLDEFTLGEGVFPSFTLYKSNKKSSYPVSVPRRASEGAVLPRPLGPTDTYSVFECHGIQQGYPMLCIKQRL